MSMSGQRNMGRRRWRFGSRVVAAVLLALTASLFVASPASASYPYRQPRYAGEVFAVAGPEGVECWIAIFFEWLEGLDWVPTDCPGPDDDNARYTRRNDTGFFGYNSVVVGRVETFGGSRRVLTGADVHVKSSQPRGPGGLANYSQLYVWNGAAWQLLGGTGWRYNTTTTTDFAPTYNWGARTSNRYYGSWSGGYQLTLAGWIGSWTWSGPALLVCAACTSVPATEPAGAPPPSPTGTPPSAG